MTEKEFKKLCNGNIPDKLKSTIEESSAKYIPIGILENMLDSFNWSTTNFQHSIFKDGYANLSVAASLELKIIYEKDGTQQLIERTFVGACNFSLSSIDPNTHFLATAKSECIKNAASDIGKYFGRGLNDGIIPVAKKIEKKSVKSNPDSKIMKQFLKAVEDGDNSTITMLTNIYEIKTENTL